MSVENRPNNHKLIRILTAAGILGGTGAVVGGKVILDELSKAKPAVSAEFIPSPASSVAINGERYVVAPTATAIPTETATPPSPTATEKPAPTATITATAEATATKAAAASPTIAPATNTPEAKKDVPCLILPEQYCSQTEVIDWTNPAGQQLKIIGLRLDSAVDIPLFMPIDGQITKVKLPDDGVFKGFQSMIFDPEDRNTLRYIFVGDLKFPNMLSLNFKKGDPVGYIQNTGIENAGGYNFLFYVIRGAGKDATSAEDVMRQMLPSAFTKEGPKAAANPQTKVDTIYINTFREGKPQ